MHYGQRQHRTHQQTIIKTYYIHFKTATILLSHSTLNYIVPNDYHHSLRATTLTLSYQCNQCCQFMLFEATFRLFLFVQHCKTSLQLAGLREHKVFSVTMSFKTFFLALLSNKVFVLFAIFILHSRESELYRYTLDGKSALAWELPFSRFMGHLSST